MQSAGTVYTSPSFSSSRPCVQACLFLPSKQEISHLSESTSGLLGWEQDPVTRPLGSLPPQFPMTCIASVGHWDTCYQLMVSLCLSWVSQRDQSPLQLDPCCSLPEAQCWRAKWRHPLSCKSTFLYKYCLSIYYVPGTMLALRMQLRRRSSCPRRAYGLIGRVGDYILESIVVL